MSQFVPTINPATDSAAGTLSAADKTKLDAATPSATASTIVARDGSGNTALGAGTTVGGSVPIVASQGNQANGYAELDGSGNLVGTLLIRQDTAANLASVVLLPGQQAFATDTGKQVTGDGTNTFANLTGWSGSGGNWTFENATAVALIGGGGTLGAGSIDLDGARTQTYHTTLSNDSFAAGYDNLTYAGSVVTGGAQIALGSSNVVCSTPNGGNSNIAIGISNQVVGAGSLGIGRSCAVLGGGGAVGIGNLPLAASIASVAIGNSSKVGYDPLAVTISGTSVTVNASGDFRQQLVSLATASTGTLTLYGLTGGSNTVFAAVQSTGATINYSSPTTSFTTSASLGSATGGFVTPYSNGTSVPGGNATALTGGRAIGKGSTAIGAGSLAYKQGQIAQANTSLGGATTYTALNTIATGSTPVAGPGFTQKTTTILCGTSTSSSPVILTLDGSGTPNYTAFESTSNTFNIQINKTLDCTVKITGRSVGGVTKGSFVRRILVSNDAGTSSAFGSGAQTVGTDFVESTAIGSALWTVGVTVDAAHNSLQVQVTGNTGGASDTANVVWVATVEANEVVA